MNADKQFLYKEETYIIRGVCFKIYNELGGGHKEIIYHNSLYNELKQQQFEVEKNKQVNIYYKNKKVGVYMPDLIINSKILIELKAKPILIKQDIQQFWHYLKGTDHKLGLLINFGPINLSIKRVIYDTARDIDKRKSA